MPFFLESKRSSRADSGRMTRFAIAVMANTIGYLGYLTWNEDDESWVVVGNIPPHYLAVRLRRSAFGVLPLEEDLSIFSFSARTAVIYAGRLRSRPSM